jgi:hypothetical protein
MLYKFKSPASGDVIMLGPHGDQLLRLLGRDPVSKGIIEPAAMPAAVQALQSAITAEASTPVLGGDDTADATVSLRQRLWPMIDMLRRAHAADEAVVWGV